MLGVLIFAIAFLVALPLVALRVHLLDRRDDGRLRHRECLANIDRLERELGIAGKTPYEPSIRYLDRRPFSPAEIQRLCDTGQAARLSGRKEYQALLDDVAGPDLQQRVSSAPILWHSSMEPKPPTTIEPRHG